MRLLAVVLGLIILLGAFVAARTGSRFPVSSAALRANKSTAARVADKSRPPASVPYHIPTWAYDGGYGADNVSASAVVKYVSYAEGSKAVRDCHSVTHGCKAVMYFDPNLVYDSPKCPDSMVAASSEDWWLHYAGSPTRRIGNAATPSARCGNLQVYAVNPGSAGAQNYLRNYLQAHGDYELFFLDDESLELQHLFAYTGLCHEDGTQYGICKTTQEIQGDDQLAANRAAMIKALKRKDGTPFKFAYNGGSVEFAARVPRHSAGLIDEGLIIAKRARPENYELELNHMAQVNRSNLFLAVHTYGNAANPDGSPGQVLMRTVFTAVIWLGFKPGHTVAWENLESGKDKLNVWPEELMYPSTPLQSMSANAKDLEVAPGVWRREFKYCYRERSPVGPCAAILNSTKETVRLDTRWFRQSYRHSLQLIGGDVISNGTTGLVGTRMDLEPGAGEMLLR